MPRTDPLANPDALVIVFAKAPRPGEVKTRLIPLLDADGAAAFHAGLVKQTLTTAINARIGAVELHCAPDTSDAFFAECAGRYRAALYPQIGPDLGTRMQRAFEHGLRICPRVILIGCDCPLLATRHLREAHDALADHDAVLIPAEDGGYALIGVTRCDARLFSDIAWGTSSVLNSTRDRLRELGWRWRELETLWDIDRPEDYRRWQSWMQDYAQRAKS